ncbi:hypothetical protein [Leptotrichia sp. oral taxon 225]|nr:hypothetical protein [Leptotrichia sp. oral taxon 225]
MFNDWKEEFQIWANKSRSLAIGIALQSCHNFNYQDKPLLQDKDLRQ